MNDSFFLNTKMIASSGSYPSCVRTLANDILNSGGYVTVQSFFQNIHVCDLKMLQDLHADMVSNVDVEEAALILSALGMLLATAEGTLDMTSEEKGKAEMARCLRLVLVFINTEMLSRKGLFEINYPGMTFDPGCEEPLGKVTEKGRDVVKQIKGEQ